MHFQRGDDCCIGDYSIIQCLLDVLKKHYSQIESRRKKNHEGDLETH